MSTWVLIVWIGVYTGSAQNIVVQDLASEEVCMQLGKQIVKERDIPLLYPEPTVSCYEIKNRLDGLVDPELLGMMR